MSHDDPTSPGAMAPARAPESLLGQTIGAYRIVSMLGEGGFGSVYLAEQSAPVRRRVALKVIKAGMDSRAVVARFEAERQALALMDHPGVAKVFDAGVMPSGRPFFVMEYVRGEPIHRYCEHERVDVEGRVRLVMQVCAAVHHAHMKGLIHRDLKPGNVLVELVDGKPAVKVIDFGVTKALSNQLTDTTFVTEHGQMIGTPEYMSPEQARGSAVDVDTRADVYSIGAILYELLTGLAPLDTQAMRMLGHAAVHKAIEEQTPIRPSERVTKQTASRPGGGEPGMLSRHLRGDLDWIVMRCLEKERARRYDSAAALARDLGRYLADEPVEAGPPSAAYRAQKFFKRHRFGVLAGAAVAVAMAAAVVGTGWGLTRAVREGSRAQAEAQAAVQARDEAEAVTAFLSDMLASAAPDASGRGVTVREVVDKSAASIGAGMQGKPLVEARLRHTLGNTYTGLGLLEAADRQLTAALEIRRKELGEDHPDTLKVLGNVAGLRHHQGRFAESETLLKQALAAWEKAGAGENADVLGLKNNLAQTYSRLGREDESVALQRQVVDGQRRVMGADHPRTLGAMINLAQSLETLGRLDEAERLVLEALEGWRRAHGEDHPGTLLAMSNLANVELSLGKRAEAESLHRRVLEARTRVLGEEHPDTVRSMSNLGWALSRLGKTEEAERVESRAWELSRKVMGEDHADTLKVALNLATLYEGMGWPERGGARERVAMLLGNLRAVAGRADAAASDLNGCAWLMLTAKPESLRDPETALRMSQRACERERATSGKELWQYLDTLALAQFRTGAPAMAAASQKVAIERLPKQGESFRAEMEGRLKEYEGAAGK